VVEIQLLGRNLSRNDCQILAIFFAAKFSAQSAPAQTPYAKLISAKMSAVQALQAPGAEWQELLGKYAALHVTPPGRRCQCTCGCHLEAGFLGPCNRCGQKCCQKCIECQKHCGRAIHYICHECLRSGQRTDPLYPIPPWNGRGQTWYFCYPCDWDRVPDVLYTPNRNTTFDPPLIEVVIVRKRVYVEHDTRQVRPMNWETLFDVVVDLEDTTGQPQRAYMNLFCFAMNPQWRRNPIVKYLEAWLPRNLGYVGVVRNTDTMYMHRELAPERPSPPSPCPYGSPLYVDDRDASKVDVEVDTPGVKFEEVGEDPEPDRNSLIYLLQTPGMTYERFEAAGFGTHSEAIRLKDKARPAADHSECPDAKRRP
jgi:hypothetical protein